MVGQHFKELLQPSLEDDVSVELALPSACSGVVDELLLGRSEAEHAAKPLPSGRGGRWSGCCGRVGGPG